MESRAGMRALLESARQSIRNRAANPTGTGTLKKGRTLEDSSSSSLHQQLKVQPAPSSSADVAEGIHFKKDTTSGTDAATAEANALSVRESQMQFVRHYHRLLLAFIEDKSKYELELPNLSSLDRVVVHALAERCNLSHESSGDRAERVMHVKKDILFFQNPEAARQVSLDDIVEKVSWKESKFQIRYVRSANPAQVATGDIGSYADEDALEKIERFRRATDEYRHARDMGYTQQELLLAEAGAEVDGDGAADRQVFAVPGRLEEILSRPETTSTPAIAMGPAPAVTSPLSSSPSPSPSASTIAAAMARSKVTAAADAAKAAAAATTTLHDEVCRACGSRVRLDGPPQGWKCSHYCAHCTRQTIWCLEEVKLREEPTKRHKRRRDEVTSSAEDWSERGHRRRGEPAVEEIDREEDEGEGSVRHSRSRSCGSSGADEALTAEDVVEMAATNDFSAKDMNWLREFASRETARVTDQISFCIDFTDLTEAHVFRRYDGPAAPSEAACWYVVLREVRELSLTVSDLVSELLSEAFMNPSLAAGQGDAKGTTAAPPVEAIHTEEAEERAKEHLGIAFPNLSVYGTECVAVCQLRPAVRWASVPHLPIHEEGLQQLRQRYGARHVYPTQSLEEAVRCASESDTPYS